MGDSSGHAGLGMRLAGAVACTLALASVSRGDVILDWNAEALDAVRLNLNVFNPSVGATGDSPPRTTRALAMTHAAIFDAVNSFDGGHVAYRGAYTTAAGASREAAAMQAGYAVLGSLFGGNATTMARLNSRRITHLADLQDAGISQQSIDAGVAVGNQAAAAILALREQDGASTAATAWPDGTVFGQYRTDTITPDAATPAAVPAWGQVTPWVLTSGDQFRGRLTGPPGPTTAAYAAAVNQVRSLGDRRRYDPAAYAGGVLPADVAADRRTAFFWAAKGLNPDGGKNASGTVTPAGQWNQIAAAAAAARSLTLEETARLFALLNLAQADAAIAAWDVKYAHDLWRPIHAIRGIATDPADPNFNASLSRLPTDLDSDPADGVDDGWKPLIPTSMHPEYVSGHSTFGAAAAVVLADFFGTDAVSFTITGDDAIGGESRTFGSFTAALMESGTSRVLGGLHYDFSNSDGRQLGQLVGRHVLDHALMPVSVPEPAAAGVAAGAGVALAALWPFVRRARRVRAAAVLAAVVATAPAARAVPTFTNVTIAAGITHVHDGSGASSQTTQTGGAAARDYDGDGFTDLFVTRIGASPILYRNLGDGRFANVTSAAGLAVAVPFNGAAWGDVDNDGQPDLFVASTLEHGRHYLFMNNGDGTFSEQAQQRGAAVPGVQYGYSPSFGDYDRDGRLDLYVTSWGGVGNGSVLLRNTGAGTFADVTLAAGVEMPRVLPGGVGGPPGSTLSFAARFSDLDGDGHPDLAVTGDYGTSRLFWNDGDGTFTNGTTTAGVGTGTNEMGSTIADYNGDGRLDWFVTSIQNGDVNSAPNGNRLYRNEGGRTFSDRTTTAGVRLGGWGWGTSFLDVDNDGLRDLVMTNGFVQTAYRYDAMRLWRNAGNGTFTDVSTAAGVTDTGIGQGLLTLDYDNDGDLDIFVANNGGSPVLYRNDGGNAKDWLEVRLVGAGDGFTNRDGIGARITVTPRIGGGSMLWEVEGGSNYLAQNDATAFFGLGDPSGGTVDLVTVRWTTGLTTELRDVPRNQRLVVAEVPEPGPAAVVVAAAVAWGGLRRLARARRG